MPFDLHTLLLKTVNYCNLECDYCYTQRFNDGQPPTVISERIVNRAIEDYAELAGERRGTGPDGRHMMFLWHGGEPMIAGMQFFERALQVQRETGDSEFIINSMTCNGTLINKNWLSFLKKNQFRMSISIDGPAEIHDLHRVSRDSKPTFNRVMQSFESLKSEDMEFGIMCVISEESIDKADEIFDFYVSNGMKRLAFLPRVSEESWLSPEKYADFMIRILDRWLEHDDPDIHIRELENIIHEVLGGRAELCEFNGCCGSYLALNCNGDVYLCDLFIGEESMRIGNILDRSLKEMLDSEDTLGKISRKLLLHEECSGCQHIQLCKGGCLYRRRMVGGRAQDKDIYCDFRQRLFDYITKKLSVLFKPRMVEKIP